MAHARELVVVDCRLRHSADSWAWRHGYPSIMAAAPSPLLSWARRAKHRAEIFKRRVVQPRVTAAKDFGYRAYDKVSPYSFDPGFYPHHFVRRPSLPTTVGTTVPRHIFTAWLGSNAMPATRVRALESIRRSNPGTDVELVTLENFADYAVEGHPFHEGFNYLGAVQKSDYVRSYILHHHGGVWMDLKESTTDWSGILDAMDADPNIWVAGYPETTLFYVADLRGPLGRHMRQHYTRLLGASAYAMKATSPFTSDWYTEQHARLTYWLEPLRRFPADSPYDIPRDHPIGWGELAYEITQPLSLKHGEHILLDRSLTPSLSNYR